MSRRLLGLGSRRMLPALGHLFQHVSTLVALAHTFAELHRVMRLLALPWENASVSGEKSDLLVNYCSVTTRWSGGMQEPLALNCP